MSVNTVPVVTVIPAIVVSLFFINFYLGLLSVVLICIFLFIRNKNSK